MHAFLSPPISVSTAHAFAAFFSFSYVGSLYLSKSARLKFDKNAKPKSESEERERRNDERWRNDPDVIKARLLAASVSTTLSVCAVFWLVKSLIPEADIAADPSAPLQTGLARLGLTFTIAQDNPFAIILPCLVAPVLYFGPLYAEFLSEELPFQRNFSFATHIKPTFFSWVGLRNHAIGPITEEIVFRACVLSVYHLSGASTMKMIFLSPLAFGVAHLHHAWDTYNRYGRTRSALRVAGVQTLFQLAYTSLFGFHCAYLFLRTGSLLPPTLSHMFCNVMGLPQYGTHVAKFPSRKLAVQAAYLAGVAGYVYAMRAWTGADASVYWGVVGPDGAGRY
ncbi:uncharacterized protein BXZ73DRAFT_92399 [Epithele typhae]|uniref:uncharacterized protein n=1 Tax=Epithele typhae TaxID=378194 RepID=UPI0020084A07|nr:uncharacterized protein BXZ73DRAFT_92399 [Epithele typhae]KAH9917138.1 hypothetical protein BXZ73DRAFT_92399 [Epithele typhae]